MKLFNLHLEKNWGETAEFEIYYNDSGAVWQLSPFRPFPAMKNLNAYREMAEFENGNNEQIVRRSENDMEIYPVLAG